MLIKINTGLLLLCFSFACIAQDEAESETDKDKAQNTKRPSWSAGLPEREKQADLSKPSFKPELDNDIELDMSEFGLKEKPQISIELPINDNLPVNIEEQVDSSPVEEDSNQPDPTVSVEQPEQITSEAQSIEDSSSEESEQGNVIESIPEVADEFTPTEIQSQESRSEEPIRGEPVNDQTVNDESTNDEFYPQEPSVQDPVSQENEAVQTLIEEPVVEQQIIERPPVNAVDDENNAQVSDMDSPVVQSQDNDVQEERTEPNNQSNEVSKPIKIVTAADEQLEYKWQVLKRVPVDYPVRAAIENLEGWVEVQVTINPAGEVISATPIKYSRRGRVFGKPAVQSVNKWLFKPPSELGITNNLTRIYTVEFDL